MSAVTPIADKGGCGRIVRFSANSGHNPWFDMRGRYGLRGKSLWSGLGAHRSARLRGEVRRDVGDILGAELDHIHNICVAHRARVLTRAVLKCLQLRLDVCRPLRREIGNRFAHADAFCAVACRAHGGGQLFARLDIRGLCNLRNGQENGQPKQFFHGSSLGEISRRSPRGPGTRMNDSISTKSQRTIALPVACLLQLTGEEVFSSPAPLEGRA